MGTYNISIQELVDAITETLDNIEGNFNRDTLHVALEACKKYDCALGTVSYREEKDFLKRIHYILMAIKRKPINVKVAIAKIWQRLEAL